MCFGLDTVLRPFVRRFIFSCWLHITYFALEQSVFRVANESGQVLLLLSLISIGREIGKEIQVMSHGSK